MDNEILTILNNQRDIRYLTWSIELDIKTQYYTVHLTALTSSTKFRVLQESLLPRVIDALLQLKGKEARAVHRSRDKWCQKKKK